MESTPIEIGKRKLQKIGGAHQMVIPSTAIKMMQLKAGEMLTCYLDGNTLLIRRES